MGDDDKLFACLAIRRILNVLATNIFIINNIYETCVHVLMQRK